MTKHNDQLLPCPFCGDPNPNLTHDDYVHDDLRPMPVVECTKCHTWVRAEAWNNRAQLPAGGAVPDFLRLTPEMREAGQRAQDDAYRDGCRSVPVLQQVWFEAAIQYWIDGQQDCALLAAPHPVSGEQRQAPSVSIGVETLKWWRQLVELNPSDLAPRIDAAITRAAPPEAQEQKPDALRKRFSDIEDEILAGKHNAQSVFTAMRTAALYIGQPAAQDVSALVEALEVAYRVMTEGGVTPEWGDDECKGLELVRRTLAAHRAQAQGGDHDYLPTKGMELWKFGSITGGEKSLEFSGFEFKGDGALCPEETVIRLSIQRLINSLEEFRRENLRSQGGDV